MKSKIDELERFIDESFYLLWNKALLHADDARRLGENYIYLMKLIEEIKGELH
jgi:hypothetical protein